MVPLRRATVVAAIKESLRSQALFKANREIREFVTQTNHTGSGLPTFLSPPPARSQPADTKAVVRLEVVIGTQHNLVVFGDLTLR